MKRRLLLITGISIVHFVVQFYSWAMADAIPRHGSEHIRELGYLAWRSLSFPLLWVVNGPLIFSGFDFFMPIMVANSMLWGLTATLVMKLVNRR